MAYSAPYGQPPPAPLQQWFASVDTDRSGHISVQELQRALAMGNLHFSLAACAHMIRLHDRDGSGSISFDEFSKLHEFLTNMQNSFTYFDRDRGGNLTPDEVQQALSHAGFRLDQPAFFALLKAFDPDRNGRLGMTEYIGMTLFLKSTSATFTAFDTQRSGRITLDFNQFVYAVAQCR